MKKKIFFKLVLLVVVGCANGSRVPYSRLHFSTQPETIEEGINEAEHLRNLIQKMQGVQFGDLIFKKNTSAYWVLPEIDRLELAVTGREAQFSADEFQKRQADLEAQHIDYVIFSLDLRMPFYSGWSQNQLMEFLKENLLVTLENGTGEVFQSERLVFAVIERFGGEPSRDTDSVRKEELEVQVPVRVLFNKLSEENPLISPAIKIVAIKLRLKQRPPFRVGFFDDKFFQGFRWKIVQEGRK